MTNPFQSSYLKIKTARRHHADLDRVIAEFSASNPIYLVVCPTKDFSGQRLIIFVRDEIPEDVVAYIGDCVHNLRASLDFMAVRLVELNGGNPNKVYFPFANEEKDLESMIKDKKFNRAHPDAVELLRKIKPYKGGNVALRAIHDFDIDDKHIDFNPVASTSRIIKLETMGLSLKDVSFTPPWNGMCLAQTPRDERFTYFEQLPIEFGLVFPHQSVFSHMKVLPTLLGLIDDVEGILHSFETLALGNAR